MRHYPLALVLLMLIPGVRPLSAQDAKDRSELRRADTIPVRTGASAEAGFESPVLDTLPPKYTFLWHLPVIEERLGLSREQMRFLADMHESVEARRMQHVEQVCELRNRVATLLDAEFTDPDQVGALLNEAETHRALARAEAAAAVQEMRDVLTPEQRRQLAEIRPNEIYRQAAMQEPAPARRAAVHGGVVVECPTPGGVMHQLVVPPPRPD